MKVRQIKYEDCCKLLTDCKEYEREKTKKETAQEIIRLIDTIESENLNSTFNEWREYKGIRNRITDKYLK